MSISDSLNARAKANCQNATQYGIQYSAVNSPAKTTKMAMASLTIECLIALASWWMRIVAVAIPRTDFTVHIVYYVFSLLTDRGFAAGCLRC